MSDHGLYDEDVYAWSEQQAAALRRLSARRDLPNELDLTHIAEEIEDVGASQLRAVRSLIRLILAHAIKCWADPEAPNARHWGLEIGNWHDDLVDEMTPAMRSKIDITALWRRAVRQADRDLADQDREDARARMRQFLTDAASPVALDDLCDEVATVKVLVGHIEAGITQAG